MDKQPRSLGEILTELERQLDPKSCLQRAADALAEQDWDEARQALKDYRAWRRRGGFEPAGGDEREQDLRRRLRQRHR